MKPKLPEIRTIILVCLCFIGLSSYAQTTKTTYSFLTPATLSNPTWNIWYTQADIVIDGTPFTLSSGGNGSFSNPTSGGALGTAHLRKDGSGGDSFTLKRTDGKAFQFYEIWVQHESMNQYSTMMTLPPWYTLNAGTFTFDDNTAMTPGTNYNNFTSSTNTISTPNSDGVTVYSVDITFYAINYYKIDNIIVGPAPDVAPTVLTRTISDIRNTTAKLSGRVSNIGRPDPTSHGVCWNTTGNPTVADSKIDKGSTSINTSFTADVTGLTPNTTYYVRAFATNRAGTSYGDQVTFKTCATIAIGSSQTNVSCFGGSNGTATATPTGGTAPYTYSWSPSGATGATASGLSAGNYTVTVTDANLCTGTQEYTITQPTAVLGGAISKTDVSCNGGNNGTATVNITGGTTPYSYSWAPSGGTNATASGLAAGTYTATVTDFNGCQITRTITINQPATALGGTISKTNVNCNAGTNGSATVNVTGGTTPYSYSWSPSGGTNATASGLAAGTYTVTVTDFNGCQITRTATIEEPSTPLMATAEAQTNVSCNGGTTGSAKVNASGGTAPYTYSWAPSGGTGATASGLAAGNYTVTVTDNSGCFTTRNFTITQPSAILVTSTVTNVGCFESSTGAITLSTLGGNPPYTYLWSTGATTSSITGLAAGNYSVTITDAQGCTAMRNFIITQQPLLVATADGQTNVSCNGGSTGSAKVTATGGTAPYTYSWAPSGGTAATATGLASGTYTVTVTDAYDCTATQSFTITQPTALVATIGSQTNISCFGGTNGIASVAVTGGTPGYTYSWSPSGGTAATATGLSAGAYTVTITDANVCQTTQNFIISQPASGLTITTSRQTDVSCFGGTNGEASVVAAGGTGAYTYSWAPSGGTAATASGLAAGVYTVTVTDANGCSTRQNFTISQPAAALTAIAAAQTNVSCYGGSNGSATVIASGGTQAYSYSWAPSGGSSATASGLVAGIYTVTVTDNNGCQATQSFTISQPTAPLTATAEGQNNVNCFGGSNGTASVIVSGGTGAYSYFWAPSGGTAATATGLAAGNYTVTVTDENGCEATQSFTIAQPTVLDVAPTNQTNISCHGNATGSATVTVTGGTMPYSYSWAPSGGTAATASGLMAGTYTVTVTDNNGCFDTQSFTITEPSALVALPSSQTNVSCNGGTDGSATVVVIGGTGAYSYSWAPSGGTAATASSLAAGNYTVTVTDNNGCQATQNFTITQPTELVATPGTQTNVSCYGGANGTATVTVAGGVPGYTYSWAPSGGSAATASGLAAGAYTVTITDANNCQTTQGFTITQPTALVATAGSQTNVSCNGGANGTATVNVTGGTAGYSYAWSPTGGTAATASGLTAGTYTVTVTDANNCQTTQSFTITQPTPLVATAGSQTDVSCYGGTNGTATVDVTGGTTGYTYTWSPSGGNNATASGLSAGVYSVLVTDANGCTASQSFTITQPTVLVATAGSQSNVSCYNGNDGSATVVVSGGTGAYSYAWAPTGGTAAIATGLSAGSYTVTVTDANGCQTTQNFTLTEPAQLTGTAVITALDSYTWIDGVTYTASNNRATFTVAAANGCDSIVTLNLTIRRTNTTLGGVRPAAGITDEGGYRFEVDCDNNSSTAVFTIVTDDAYATIWYQGAVVPSKQITIDISTAGVQTITFTIESESGTATQSYSFTIERRIPFYEIVVQRWNNTLTVINNPANNGGYTFTSYRWFRNGSFLTDDQSYSAGNSNERLDTNDDYYVELTAEGHSGTLRTCIAQPRLNVIQPEFFPNPVPKDVSAYLQVDEVDALLDGAYVDVFDTKGQFIERLKVHGRITTLPSHKTSGSYLYMLHTADGGVYQMKLIVK